MEKFITAENVVNSTVSRFDGEWMYTAELESPIYPGVTIRFKGRSYQVADDRTLKVRFAAKSAEDARSTAQAISTLINKKNADIRAGILVNAALAPEELHDALADAVQALDAAGAKGAANEWVIQRCAKVLVAMGNLSFKKVQAKSQSRVQARERAAAAALAASRETTPAAS